MNTDKKKSLFEIAVLHHDDNGTTEVVKPKTVLAKSIEIAKLVASREVSEEYSDKLNELEIIVRPFSAVAGSTGVGEIEDFLENNPNSYLLNLPEGRVIVYSVSNGKGYCPIDLLKEGKFEQAARFASKCFAQGL